MLYEGETPTWHHSEKSVIEADTQTDEVQGARNAGLPVSEPIRGSPGCPTNSIYTVTLAVLGCRRTGSQIWLKQAKVTQKSIWLGKENCCTGPVLVDQNGMDSLGGMRFIKVPSISEDVLD